MNARQLAEYRDVLARHRITQQDRDETLRRAARAASIAGKQPRTRKRPKRQTEEPRPLTRTQQERILADKLLPNVSEYSVVRRDWQALDVARLIVQARLREHA